MAKKMCKLVKKDLQKEDFEGFKAIVKDAKYCCLSCGRVSSKSGQVCKPKKI